MRCLILALGLLALSACSSSSSSAPAQPLADRDTTTLTDAGDGLADTIWGWRLEGSNHYRVVEREHVQVFLADLKIEEDEGDPEVSWKRIDFSQGIGGPLADQAQGVLETEWELEEDGEGGWQTVGLPELAFLTLADNDIIYRYTPLVGEQWTAFMPATVEDGQRWRIEEDWLGAGYAIMTTDVTVESLNAASPASDDTAPASHPGCIRLRLDIEGEGDIDADEWDLGDDLSWDGTGTISISGTIRVYIKPGLGMVHGESDLSLSVTFTNVDTGLTTTTMRITNRVRSTERYADALPELVGDG